MKVILVQPPIQDFYQTGMRLQPIGLGYLKAAAGKYLPQVQVLIKDFQQGFGRRSIPLPPELSYLRPYYPCNDGSPFSTFFHYYHFGAGFDEIAESVANEQPDLVGISSLFSPYYREVLRTAEAIRRRCGAPIVIGGSHASAAPETLLDCPCVDFVVRGEGERPFVQLIRALMRESTLREVPNLIFRDGGKWIWNAIEENYTLEEIPFPDLSDLDSDRYRYNGRNLGFLIASRGCPHRCSFCAVHLTFGHRHRRRAPEDIVEEMRLRYREGIRVFDFEDDNLTFSLPDMKELCRRISAAFAPGEIELLAMNGISYHSLDAELLRWMRRAGFTQLNISLVSSDDELRRTLNRPHTRQQYLEVVEAAAQLGFRTVSYQILGLPGESLESMLETLCTNIRLPVLLGASVFYLTPRTPVAAAFPPMSESDLFRSRSTAMAFPTAECSRDDLYTLFITSRIMNFLKGLHFQEDRCGLAEALSSASRSSPRGELGARLLTRLLREGTLAAVHRGATVPLQKFNPRLFRTVWNRAGRLATLCRKAISLDSIPEF